MKTPVAIIGVVLIIVLVCGAYYVGMRHALAPAVSIVPTPAASVTSTSSASDYYQNTSTWQTITETSADFSIKYPLDFTLSENLTDTPSIAWRLDSRETTGIQVLAIAIPAAFEPQTNFLDATLTVGYSKDATAVADCFTPPQGSTSSSTIAKIRGTPFTVFTSNDAGAGNLYDTTSYRAVHGGACYAIEYTIHSAELGNYPPSYDLHQYDSGMVTDVLNRMVGTFSFI